MLREETLRLLANHALEPDASRDEQQLVDPAAIEDLLDAACVGQGDRVLEVGPGAGNITVRAACRGAAVTAVEKNPMWMSLLSERLADHPSARIIVGDALTLRLPPFDKAVSNLPYGIAEALLQRLTRLRFTAAAFIVPASFAEKVTASSIEKYTKLSFVSNLFFEARVTRSIPRESYLPPPDTSTSILAVKPRASVPLGDGILQEALRQGDKKAWNALREAVVRRSPQGSPRATKRGAEGALRGVGIAENSTRVARLDLGSLMDLRESLKKIEAW